MRQKSRQLALSGMLTALAVVLLLLGGILPLALFCAPMLAILVLLPVKAECGPRMAWTAWAAVSLLALLLVADRELTLFYVFFGWYPMLKPWIDRCPRRSLRLLYKVGFCTVSIAAIYALLIFLFRLEALIAEFQAASLLLNLVTLVMANVAFLLLDELIARFTHLWQQKLRRRFFRG